MNADQRFPVGTQFMTRGKAGRLCTVTDFHVTRNLAGDVVKVRYVATHPLMGQEITDSDVPETTVAMGVAALKEKSR